MLTSIHFWRKLTNPVFYCLVKGVNTFFCTLNKT